MDLESNSLLITSTPLAHPDPFLPLLPHSPAPSPPHYTPSLHFIIQVKWWMGEIFTYLKTQEEKHVPVSAYLDRLNRLSACLMKSRIRVPLETEIFPNVNCFHCRVNPRYKGTHYNSKILYNIILICTKWLS